MNITPVRCPERAREIGLRQAAVCQVRRHSYSVLVEAVALSIAGGFIGILLGIPGIDADFTVGGLDTVVWARSWTLGLFSRFGGNRFRLLPREKAADPYPIEALRSELT